LIDILELQFQISKNMYGRSDFEQMDFFEFIWLYERIAKDKKSDQESDGSKNFLTGG